MKTIKARRGAWLLVTLRGGTIMSVGTATVFVGAFLPYAEADLSRWVSIGILTAGILLFIDVAAIMFAGGSRADPVAPARPTSVVRESRGVVSRNEPR